MALQVWLPLNGNLNNQGLADVTVTNNGATINTAGKIGSCYSFGSSKSYLSCTPSFATSMTGGVSFACWLKLNDWGPNYAAVFDFHVGNVSWNQEIFAFQKNGNGNSMVFNITDGQSATTTNCHTGAIELNVWYHFVCVYTPGNIKIFQNGTQVSSYNTTIVPNVSSITNCIIGSATAGGAYQLNGCINDFRVYDHVLSPREVKEISKGLVLHYPLAMPGQENNIKASTIHNRGCNGFSYSSATNTWTMTAPIGSSVWGYGIVINDASIKWESGESWVVSMEVYVPKAISWNHDINNKPDVSDTSPYTGNDYDDQRLYCSNGVMSSHNLQAGWNKIWFTQRAPAAYGLFNYSTNFGIVTTNETSAIDIQIRNIKGEIISAGLEVKPSPWLPNPADAAYSALGFNDGIEYDVSGYGNNGTRNGTFSWSSDTPRYVVSTKFDTTSTKIRLPVMSFSGMANSYTFAWWQYNVSTGNMPWGFSDGNRINLYHCSPLCWNTGDGSSNQFKDGNTTISPTTVQNRWHHMVITGDGTETKLYIDGEYKGTATIYKALTGTQIWISGWDSSGSYTFSGSKISDFRIYSTALSADDILELYHTSASLADNGTLMAYEFNEV